MSEAVRLHRIVYCSRVAPAVLPMIDAALRDVMAASMRNNAPAGITGLLVAHNGWFVQALEGPDLAVERRLDVIRTDPRHSDLSFLGRTDATERAFPGWSMCAYGLSAADSAIVGTLSARDFDPPAWSAPAAMRLLTTVASVHARTLSDRVAAEAAAARAA